MIFPSSPIKGELVKVDGSIFRYDGIGWNREIISTASGSSSSVYKTITSDYAVRMYEALALDTSNNEITVTLPSGIDQGEVYFLDLVGTFSTNKLTVKPASGEVIMGMEADEVLEVDTDNISFTLKFLNNNWRLV